MKVFNNLTRRLEDFIPINLPYVNFYSCGPTVYDLSHIGHARSCITWDLLYRYLKYRGYKVRWIRNITNVDDKIVKRAKELGLSPDALSRIFTYEFWADMKALNISVPEYEPRATDYLQQMYSFIQKLIDKGFAYEVNGDVYFRVAKHPNYGQLKGQNLEELHQGMSRVENDSSKEDRLDFALWKAFPDNPEASFKSPWSIGRPGWHLECSTMIDAILEENKAGYTLDIHAGGDDLVHPHHENECAQSEVLSGKALAKYWMHNGMVMVNGSKMSKSEGNFFTIRELLGKYKSNTIRYFSLISHYKKQINFSHEALSSAETGFDKLYQQLRAYIPSPGTGYFTKIEIPPSELNSELIEKFNQAMDNDLNTSQAISIIFENKEHPKTLIYLLDILGFDLINHEKSNLSFKDDLALNTVMDLVLDLRTTARTNKDFQTSDKIRDTLTQANIKVQDYRDKPSEWELA